MKSASIKIVRTATIQMNMLRLNISLKIFTFKDIYL